MDQQPDLGGQRLEAIRHPMDETRDDFTEKFEALEQRVKDTVADGKRTVAATVATIKQSAGRSVQAVKVQSTIP